jgi:hypothetical protein
MARQAGINISAESAKAHMEAQKSKPPLGKPDGK